ncbi:hypothetical protein MFLO_13078 [Listeria floridensis FSL S10-1187]|uniref:Lipoprotein n=1 Tax=Listeria floridensis FSL S10-1187 TaxID=1265817 RepID=A0ABP3AWM6_9LIST|nr:hypothetical protein [Listeria floridensis]EUJ27403.1 hypothetical protein MFLO_13078 [Listeria floridensis FSL S10-1187]
MTIRDRQYSKLSDVAYWLDPKHDDYSLTMKEGNGFELDGYNYKILKTENNSKNGMQAMTVAPVDKNKKSTPYKSVIAYVEINFSAAKDPLNRSANCCLRA